MADSRKTAVNALMRVNCGAAYSNIVLNEVLAKSGLTGADRALASALFYGVLDRKITLDYIISQFVKTPREKNSAAYNKRFKNRRLPDILYG